MGLKHRIVGGRGWESSQIQLAEIPRGSTLSPSPQEAHINPTGSQGPSVSIHYKKKKKREPSSVEREASRGPGSDGSKSKTFSTAAPYRQAGSYTHTKKSMCLLTPDLTFRHACLWHIWTR